MLSALETLDKIVTQEKRLGYRNKAVIGGLDKFASTWEREALAQAQTPDEKQFVADIVARLASYPAVEDRQERAKIVGDILAKVNIVLPAKLSEEEKELFRRLNKLRPAS